MYSTDSAKWKAYTLSDPFTTGMFVACNKATKLCCRPDCDAQPQLDLPSDVSFYALVRDAMAAGYSLCEQCDPAAPPLVDVDLLKKTVAEINAKIGFVIPDDSDDDYRSCDLSLKNDSEHYKLVDIACRHLALAAAMLIFNPTNLLELTSPRLDDGYGERKRKRRGGVLGFKELAAKLKLSAWHFHRVFKLVTGLTPKTYGDRCWEYLREERDMSSHIPQPQQHYLTPTPLSLSSLNLLNSLYLPTLPLRKRASEDLIEAPSKKMQTQMPMFALATPSEQFEPEIAVDFSADYCPSLFAPDDLSLFPRLDLLDVVDEYPDMYTYPKVDEGQLPEFDYDALSFGLLPELLTNGGI